MRTILSALAALGIAVGVATIVTGSVFVYVAIRTFREVDE